MTRRLVQGLDGGERCLHVGGNLDTCREGGGREAIYLRPGLPKRTGGADRRTGASSGLQGPEDETDWKEANLCSLEEYTSTALCLVWPPAGEGGATTVTLSRTLHFSMMRASAGAALVKTRTPAGIQHNT
eukprot:1180171-Prorocentrum_minimum.AAC.1